MTNQSIMQSDTNMEEEQTIKKLKETLDNLPDGHLFRLGQIRDLSGFGFSEIIKHKDNPLFEPYWMEDHVSFGVYWGNPQTITLFKSLHKMGEYGGR